jgi:nitrile hydratase accessory protein
MRRFPLQPCDGEGPVFSEPWEAQAFGLVIALHQQGLFSWDQWASALSEEIRKAQDQGDPDLGNTYYQHWLCALEKMLRLQGICSDAEMAARKSQWISAYENTPHGKPIELSAAQE